MTDLVNAAELPGFSRILLLLAGLGGQHRRDRLHVPVPHGGLARPGATCGRGPSPAGIAFSLLQYFGTEIVKRITDNAGDTYGQFALVLGLVTWLGFLAISALMAPNSTPPSSAVARERRRHSEPPQSRLRRDFGDPPLRIPDANGERYRCWRRGHMAYPAAG